MEVTFISGFLTIGTTMVKVKNIISIEGCDNEGKVNFLDKLSSKMPEEMREKMGLDKIEKPDPTFAIVIVSKINTVKATTTDIEFKTKEERDEVLAKVNKVLNV